MKKIVSVVLALTLALSLAACGGKKAEVTTPPVQEVPASAVEILEKTWAEYAESEKFAIVGGNVEAGIMDAPANYDMAYAENMTYSLLVPTDQIPNVAEAASMIHMMNANTFTCGVFRMAEGASVGDFAAAMEAAIQGNMWMCGFPESLLIKDIAGEYVLVAFGLNDTMTTFENRLNENYPDAEVLYSEPIGG